MTSQLTVDNSDGKVAMPLPGHATADPAIVVLGPPGGKTTLLRRLGLANGDRGLA